MCVSVLEVGLWREFVRVEEEEEGSCCCCCCCCCCPPEVLPPSMCVCVAAALDEEPWVCVCGCVDVMVAAPFTFTRRMGPAPPAAEGPLPPCMMVVCVCVCGSVLVDGGTPPTTPAPPRPLGLVMTRRCACSQGLRGEACVCVCVCGLVLEGCAVEEEEGGWRLEGKGAMNGLG